MNNNVSPKKSTSEPKIYAYEYVNHPDSIGCLKVGYTTRTIQERIHEQLGSQIIEYRIVLEEDAIKEDGSTPFSDKVLHRHLKNKGFEHINNEWFRCTVNDVKIAIEEIKTGKSNDENRTFNFPMRPEQLEAVEKTMAYFNSVKKEDSGKAPHFLWNAKMRFGKTFTAYQLALKMGWTRVLVLTFKPAVQTAWEEDLLNHQDFTGWQFVSKSTISITDADLTKPLVCFGSFQDYLGKNPLGGIKTKNEWVHTINWDCIILDEYHFGAWGENAKELIDADLQIEDVNYKGNGQEYFDEELMPITTKHYLYLSGTPFRAIASGEFIEEQIFNWTYSDEQRAKAEWVGEKNPYLALPKMVLMTYQMPEQIRNIALKGEYNEFDLNVFFSAEGEGDTARFVFENEVQKWLDLMRGQLKETIEEGLKQRDEKPPFPFSHLPFLEYLQHTLWFLPKVNSCYAMRNLMQKRNNTFYQDYTIVVAAGTEAGIGMKALTPVKKAMQNPLKTKTITLTCGKLTTGVTVKPWTGILMLRNTNSPETYFQTAFRVQSPWTIHNPDNKSPNNEEIIKEVCYVFDFALDRALKQIADYSSQLDTSDISIEHKVKDFTAFMPVLAYDGSMMREINASEILDMVMNGTTATLLAKKWESALLVNVDNATLERLKNNPQALEALMRIEAFRTLNKEIQTIINKSNAVKKLKKESTERDLTVEEKKELSKEEKEYKNLRKQIQEKLIKFATRIPVFMYLTDYREETLRDVVTKLEPGLFKKVTALEIDEFELLVSIGVFNGPLMNDAIYKFRRYEENSLEYLGINLHINDKIGLLDTVINKESKLSIGEPQL
ncbi:MAG: GIY-YIG nuclease family protein [Candidatus Kapabacteria bacterium]|nr:GIY-YIG nuclease family protein [Candidatus Kapabacteria bacterium]